MEQTLRQLGELLLGSVPTVILLTLLYVLYTLLVHRPLTAVLAERRSRTEGAMEKARADIAAAAARTAEYEQRLREARQNGFQESGSPPSASDTGPQPACESSPNPRPGTSQASPNGHGRR